MAALALVAGVGACTTAVDRTGATTSTSTSTSTSTTAPAAPDPFGGTTPRVDPRRLPCPANASVADALQRAVGFLRGQRTPRADATWALEVVGRRWTRFATTDPLAGRSLGEPSDPARRLVDADASVAPWLPTASDDPQQRLVDDIDAVFRPVDPASTRAVVRFVTRRGLTGYALTHQWFALIWARELHRPLPAQATAREPALAAAVRAEVGRPGETQDLWAERAALLATWAPSRVDAATRAAWTCRALATQEPLGYWRTDGTYEQRYDGGTFPVTADAEHVTALMAMLLAGLHPQGAAPGGTG